MIKKWLYLTCFLCLFASLYSIDNYSTIDVVYTWVDDQDPDWDLRRNKARLENAANSTPDSNTKTRYRNRNELKYSLRSVFAFAPFVRHIFIVTAGQKPSWLKEHNKITIVNHKKLFLNKNDLPTFNSHAIEANLHRIRGLSDKFIYLNDDVFFGSPVNARDFFSRTGKIKLSFSGVTAPFGIHSTADNGYVAGWKNTNDLLNRIFKPRLRESFEHAPFPMRKSIIKRIEQQFPHVFSLNSSHKFRSFNDYTLTNGLIPYWAYYKGYGARSCVRNITVWFDTSYSINKASLAKLRKSTPKTFCIEDVGVQDDSSSYKLLKKFLENYFPIKAPWEK